MSQFILLSPSDAASVAGPSAARPALARLSPVLLTDGRFTLGAEVLADPAHASHVAFLATLPQIDLATLTPLLPTPVVIGSSQSLGARMLDAVKAFFAPDAAS